MRKIEDRVPEQVWIFYDDAELTSKNPLTTYSSQSLCIIGQ